MQNNLIYQKNTSRILLFQYVNLVLYMEQNSRNEI